MALLNFDASQVAPASAPDPVPAGWYTAMMTKSEMKPTSDGTGQFLETENTIVAPAEFAGRKVFDRINLQNKNPVAVEIGYKTLSAICHAVGIIQVQDSQQLHDRPFAIKVSLRPAGPGADGKNYEASNDVKGYKAASERTTPAPAAVAPPAWTPPPAAVAPPAWTPPPVAQAPAAPAWQPPAAQMPPQQAAAPQWAPPQQPAQAPAQAPQQQQAAAAPPWASQQQAPQAAGAPVAPPWAK